MRLAIISVVLTTLLSGGAYAGPFGPGNFSECILDRMPGVENDPTATAIAQTCIADFGHADSVEPGSGRGLFKYESGAECAAKVAAKTRSSRAGAIIRSACNRLYDKPDYFDQFDPATLRPAQ